MNISGYDSSSMSTLLSSLGSSKSSSSIFNINLGDYNMIKTGSYGKLLKSYYSSGLDQTGTAAKADEAAKSSSTSKDSAKVLTGIKDSASALVSSAQDLYKSTSAVFKKTSGEYDTDKIYSAVKSFVDDYNDLLDAVDKSKTSNIKSANSSMQLATTNYSTKLAAIGISIDSKSGELSIDADKFKASNMDDVKSLFSGNGSFAYATAVKASGINSYANIESSKSATYGTSGTYTYNNVTGELFSSSI